MSMDITFILMPLLTGLTGLLLMVLCTTPAMSLFLAIHLGVVFSLFLRMPYGKFITASTASWHWYDTPGNVA
ncbi:MAG: hypothetical protein ACRECY_12345 [Phyllobacterium sp.]